jgi:chromosome segregation ATPase
MGIERIVTDEAVFEIADQLTEKGEKVTNRAIWSAIGGGSMTTISQSLRHWRERQELQVTQPIERTPLPVALVDILHHAASQLWDAALSETKAELEQLAQATNARISEAQNERDDTLAELQATAEELEQVKAERDERQAEIDSQAQQLISNAAEIAVLKAELAAQTLATTQAIHRAETAEAARMELLARVEQLTNLLIGEQTARQQAETDANALRLALAKQSAELEASHRHAADLDTRATAEISTLKTERQELQTLLKTLMDKIGTVKDNSQIPHPHADRQNTDLFSDDSVEKSKPIATPTKRRKTVKSASDKP